MTAAEHLHSRFLDWVSSNYLGYEAQLVLDHQLQSGDYPQAFLDTVELEGVDPRLAHQFMCDCCD